MSTGIAQRPLSGLGHSWTSWAEPGQKDACKDSCQYVQTHVSSPGLGRDEHALSNYQGFCWAGISFWLVSFALSMRGGSAGHCGHEVLAERVCIGVAHLSLTA